MNSLITLQTLTDDKLLELASVQKYTNLEAEISREYFDLRTAGISTLQYCKKEFIEYTKEDLDWYTRDLDKKGVYKREVDRRLISNSKYNTITRELDLSESLDYLRDCRTIEKETLESYIERHWYELYTRYSLAVSEWFMIWYGFWSDEYTHKKDSLDWTIFFSMLNPRLPDNAILQFPTIIRRVNTITRKLEKPIFLKQCWNNEEIRNKVLAGEQFDYPRYMCPYSTIYSYIQKRAEPKEKSSRTRIRRPLTSKVLILRLTSKLIKEGVDITTALEKATKEILENGN